MGRSLAAAAAAALFIAALAARARLSPSVDYLPGGGPAWIVAPKPLGLKARFTAPTFVHFRRRFVAGAAEAGELRLRARRESQVVLDGKVVLPPGEAEGGWKNERRVVLRPGPGQHELLIVVRAEPGPAALSAEARAWGLSTDETWETAAEGRGWPLASLAAAPRRAEAYASRPSAASAFLVTLPWLVPFILFGAWAARRGLRHGWRWAAAGWLALSALNLARLIPGAGYDALQHAELARLVAASGLPGPGASWQSFQAPLYHALCAPLALLPVSDDALIRLMRLPNLACGFLLALLCARFAAEARPRRPDAAAAAGLFGLALAPNLYMSQAPGNEPLAAVLAAAFLLSCLRVSGRESAPAEAFLLGATLGAALLAKTTAALAAPAGLLLLAGRRPWRWWGAGATGLALAGGWWYARSWLHYGSPFTGGWDAARGFAWTQDPGYRTFGDFVRFGAVLSQPVYSGVAGFWDALYSTLWLDGWQGGVIDPWAQPHWSPRWQAAAAAWGLAPTAFLLAGCRKALGRAEAPALAAMAALGTGLAALLWMFLSVPVYSTVKASYLLGLAPAAAFLLVEGLPERGAARVASWALLAGWAACSVLAHLPR
ncbi:MAG: hypothetical protein SF051_14310 [Elusimicrobiota bacterium]|nr:hypothetical protein [Elusimicrobiota bacterium]